MNPYKTVKEEWQAHQAAGGQPMSLEVFAQLRDAISGGDRSAGYKGESTIKDVSAGIDELFSPLSRPVGEIAGEVGKSFGKEELFRTVGESLPRAAAEFAVPFTGVTRMPTLASKVGKAAAATAGAASGFTQGYSQTDSVLGGLGQAVMPTALDAAAAQVVGRVAAREAAAHQKALATGAKKVGDAVKPGNYLGDLAKDELLRQATYFVGGEGISMAQAGVSDTMSYQGNELDYWLAQVLGQAAFLPADAARFIGAARSRGLEQASDITVAKAMVEAKVKAAADLAERQAASMLGKAKPVAEEQSGVAAAPTAQKPAEEAKVSVEPSVAEPVKPAEKSKKKHTVVKNGKEVLSEEETKELLEDLDLDPKPAEAAPAETEIQKKVSKEMAEPLNRPLPEAVVGEDGVARLTLNGEEFEFTATDKKGMSMLGKWKYGTFGVNENESLGEAARRMIAARSRLPAALKTPATEQMVLPGLLKEVKPPEPANQKQEEVFDPNAEEAELQAELEAEAQKKVGVLPEPDKPVGALPKVNSEVVPATENVEKSTKSIADAAPVDPVTKAVPAIQPVEAPTNSLRFERAQEKLAQATAGIAFPEITTDFAKTPFRLAHRNTPAADVLPENEYRQKLATQAFREAGLTNAWEPFYDVEFGEGGKQLATALGVKVKTYGELLSKLQEEAGPNANKAHEVGVLRSWLNEGNEFYAPNEQQLGTLSAWVKIARRFELEQKGKESGKPAGTKVQRALFNNWWYDFEPAAFETDAPELAWFYNEYFSKNENAQSLVAAATAQGFELNELITSFTLADKQAVFSAWALAKPGEIVKLPGVGDVLKPVAQELKAAASATDLEKAIPVKQLTDPKQQVIVTKRIAQFYDWATNSSISVIKRATALDALRQLGDLKKLQWFAELDRQGVVDWMANDVQPKLLKKLEQEKKRLEKTKSKSVSTKQQALDKHVELADKNLSPAELAELKDSPEGGKKEQKVKQQEGASELGYFEQDIENGTFVGQDLMQIVEGTTSDATLRKFRKMGIVYGISAYRGEPEGVRMLEILHNQLYPNESLGTRQIIDKFFGKAQGKAGKSEFTKALLAYGRVDEDLAGLKIEGDYGPLQAAAFTKFFEDAGYSANDARLLSRVGLRFYNALAAGRPGFVFAKHKMSQADLSQNKITLGEEVDFVNPMEILVHELLHHAHFGIKNHPNQDLKQTANWTQLEQSLKVLESEPGTQTLKKLAQLLDSDPEPPVTLTKKLTFNTSTHERAVTIAARVITNQLQANHFGIISSKNWLSKFDEISPALKAWREHVSFQRAQEDYGFQVRDVLKANLEWLEKQPAAANEIQAATVKTLRALLTALERAEAVQRELFVQQLKTNLLLQAVETPPTVFAKAAPRFDATASDSLSHEQKLVGTKENKIMYLTGAEPETAKVLEKMPSKLQQRGKEIYETMGAMGSWLLGGVDGDGQPRLSWFTKLFAPTHFKYKLYEERGVGPAQDANHLLLRLNTEGQRSVYDVLRPIMVEDQHGLLDVNKTSEFYQFINPKDGKLKAQHRDFVNAVRDLTNSERGVFRYDHPSVHQEFNKLLAKLPVDSQRLAIQTFEALYSVNRNIGDFQVKKLGQETELMLARWLMAFMRDMGSRDAKSAASNLNQGVYEQTKTTLAALVQARKMLASIDENSPQAQGFKDQIDKLHGQALVIANAEVVASGLIPETATLSVASFMVQRLEYELTVAKKYADQPGYLSMERKGRFMVQVGEGDTKIVVGAQNKAEAEILKRKMEEKYPDRHVFYYDKYERYGRHTGNLRQSTALELMSMEKNALETWFEGLQASGRFDSEQLAAMRSAVNIGSSLAKDIATQGMKRNLSSRSFVDHDGMLDTLDSFVEHTLASVHGATSRTHRLEAELIKNDPATLRSTEFKNDFEHTFNSISEPEGRPAQLIKTGIAAFFMGFNLSSAAVETTQSAYTLMAHLLREGSPLTGKFSASDYYSRATHKVFKIGKPEVIRRMRGSVDPKEREFAAYISNAFEDGFLSLSHLAESTGVQDQNAVIHAKLGNAMFDDTSLPALAENGLLHASTWAMKLHTMATDKNLQLAFLAHLEKGWDLGYRGDRLEKYARLQARLAMGGGGKVNRPGLVNLVQDPNVRGAIAVTQALQTYSYMVVAHWLTDAKKALSGNRAAAKAFAYQTAVGVSLSGVLGLPFAGATMVLLEELFGVKAQEAVREGLAALAGEDEELGSFISNGMMNGLANQVTGIDIGSRVSISDTLGFNKFDGYNVQQLLGPGVSLIGKLVQGSVNLMKGDVKGAATELAPPALRGLVQYDSMWQTTDGDLVMEPSGFDRAVALTGFRPNRLVVEKQRARALDISRRIDSQRRKENLQLLAEHILQGNNKAVLSAVQEKATEDKNFDPRAYIRAVVDQAIDIKIPRDVLSRGKGSTSYSATYISDPLRRSELALLMEKESMYRSLGYPFGIKPITAQAVARAKAIDAVIRKTGLSRSEAIAYVDRASTELGL